MEHLKKALSVYEEAEKKEAEYSKRLLDDFWSFDPDEYRKLNDQLKMAVFALANAARAYCEAEEYRREYA